MKKIVLVLLLIAVLVFIFDSQYFVFQGKTVKENLLAFSQRFNTSEHMMALDVKKGEIFFEKDKWHTPFQVLLGDKIVFEGMIISKDVVSPNSGYVKNGSINITFKGVNFPWQ